jgi:hypothetical protein
MKLWPKTTRNSLLFLIFLRVVLPLLGCESNDYNEVRRTMIKTIQEIG